MSTINLTFRGTTTATGSDPADRIIVTAVVEVTDAIQAVLAGSYAAYSATVTVSSAKFTRASTEVVTNSTGSITATCTFGAVKPGAADNGRVCTVDVTAMGTGLFSVSAHCSVFDKVVVTTEPAPPVTPPSVIADGLLGNYYTNPDLSGVPAATRVDPSINFYPFTEGTLPAIIDYPYFSVKWTGQIQAPADGGVQFRLTHDNGARMYIDSELRIDAWGTEGVVTNVTTWSSWVSGDKHEVQIDLENRSGTSAIKLEWQYSGQDWQVVPLAYLFSGDAVAPALDPPPAERERTQVFITTINRYPEA